MPDSTLWGDGGRALAATADDLQTAQSDLTCDLSRRVSRRYVKLPDGWEAPEPRPAATAWQQIRSALDSASTLLSSSPQK